jgi:hypothetical protein
MKEAIPPKRAFVFELTENLEISLSTGIIGHRREVETPSDYREDGRFFIGNSYSKLIFGPFVQVGEKYEDKTSLGFVRRTGYGTQVKEFLCEFRFRFQSGLHVPITQGASWFQLCRIVGIDPYVWGNLHQAVLTDRQFGMIEGILYDMNVPAQKIA